VLRLTEAQNLFSIPYALFSLLSRNKRRLRSGCNHVITMDQVQGQGATAGQTLRHLAVCGARGATEGISRPAGGSLVVWRYIGDNAGGW